MNDGLGVFVNILNDISAQNQLFELKDKSVDFSAIKHSPRLKCMQALIEGVIAPFACKHGIKEFISRPPRRRKFLAYIETLEKSIDLMLAVCL